MHTVLDAIHTSNCVSQKIAEAHANDMERSELTPQEQAENIAAKNVILEILTRSIKDVESILIPLKDESESFDLDAAFSTTAIDVVNDSIKAPGEISLGGMIGKDHGLEEQASSLQKMAEEAGPIFDAFDDVLDKPHLKNYNAMLNSVPIVGLKGEHVMYSEIKTSGTSGIIDEWSIFGRIPDGANINGSNAVHFFPYKGDFCMSVGATVYRKKHRDERDPELELALHNWPKLYLDTWEKIGDSCLPYPDARSIIPFVALEGKDIRFHLVILGQDDRLMSLDNDLCGSNNTYLELRNASDENNTAARGLRIQRAAYWNGNIVALDDASNTWQLDVNFTERKFTAADPVAVDSLSELTATNVGLVGVKKDGWIYRGRCENMAEKKISWERWMEQNGVTNLGVASPGVMLNFDALCRSIRTRHINVQASMYPVVNKLQAFAINHELFLKKQLEAAEEYQKSENNKVKQKTAIKEAKKLVTQAKIWSSIMCNQSNLTKKSLDLMCDELSPIKFQLDQQLIVLRDKLNSIKAHIQVLLDTKDKLDTFFWVSIGTMLPGVGRAIVGAFTGSGAIGLRAIGGELFIGGLVAACSSGNQSAKFPGDIDLLQNEVNGVSQAIGDLKSVMDNLEGLRNLYETLIQFWNRIFKDAQSLKNMDEHTALQIGERLFENTASIEASLPVIRRLKNGCATYLSVLNKQGIMLPAEDDEDDEE
ncbi:hypothetical protein V8C35DRAFT_302992 [Trichoderma chlorosporum]